MRIWVLLVFISLVSASYAQFDQYFINKTLRLDYHHTGNDEQDIYSFEELIEEPYWGGNKNNPIDVFHYGQYMFKVYSLKENAMIYSMGYSSLFSEWQTSDEAMQTWRTLSESVVFPYPKDSVRVEFYRRNWDGEFEKKFEYIVNPEYYKIKKNRRLAYPSFDVMVNGDPSQKIDIVILPEGYTEEEMGKFIEDCSQFAKDIFRFSPFTENKDKFNIRGILAPSQHSGTDNPADTVWQNTLMNTTFYTFDSERYLMTYDNKSVRDLAANAPYDQIYILVNSDKYGGGAIYNHYNVSVMNNGESAKIIIHEFGHGFAGLADEYYDSSTGYNEFYNLKVEPWEPNITTLIDFNSKWKKMVRKKTPVPTPAEEKYFKKVGAFEGGGYVTKGVYRPMHDCLMKSFEGDAFCPVCTDAIQRMIDFYTE